MYTTNQIFLTDFRYPVQAFCFFCPQRLLNYFAFPVFSMNIPDDGYLRNTLFKLRNVIKYCFIYLKYLISSIISFIDIFPVLFYCHPPYFQTFENDIEGGYGNTVYSPTDTSEISQVTFETIPDILAKTVTATALRPRISCTDVGIQKQSAKRVGKYFFNPSKRGTILWILTQN